MIGYDIATACVMFCTNYTPPVVPPPVSGTCVVLCADDPWAGFTLPDAGGPHVTVPLLRVSPSAPSGCVMFCTASSKVGA